MTLQCTRPRITNVDEEKRSIKKCFGLFRKSVEVFVCVHVLKKKKASFSPMCLLAVTFNGFGSVTGECTLKKVQSSKPAR